MRGIILDFIARSWIKQWLKPSAGIGHVLQFSKDKVLVIHDRIYLCEQINAKMTVRFLDDQPSFARPLRGGLAFHPISKHIYFGEYLNGHTRDIRIFSINTETLALEVCWKFSRTEIKHVHAIHYDSYRNRFWVLTGDTDHESAFYYTDDEFQSLHKFAGGSQQWRAIAMLISPDAIEWGMDAGQDASAEDMNYLYKYTFSTDTLTRHELVGNPVYAATACGLDNALIATTFEPARKQPTIPSAEIWWQSSEKNWISLLRFDFKKSRRTRIGQYGMVYLPYGVLPKNTIVCTPVNSSNFDYCTVLYKLN
ncbi:MAG: hypothetical protein ACK4NN_01185 [Rheinheimera sp.]